MATPTGSGSAGRSRPREGSGKISAVRGAGLVGLAVVLGIVLLQVIDDGPERDGGATPAGQTTTTPTSAAPATSQPAAQGAAPRARDQVRVIVFNAGSVSGAAGNMTNKLRAQGYQIATPSNTNARRGTAVQCKQGFEKEATQLQGDVGPGTTVEPFANPPLPEAEGVNCIVLVGQ